MHFNARILFWFHSLYKWFLFFFFIFFVGWQRMWKIGNICWTRPFRPYFIIIFWSSYKTFWAILNDWMQSVVRVVNHALTFCVHILMPIFFLMKRKKSHTNAPLTQILFLTLKKNRTLFLCTAKIYKKKQTFTQRNVLLAFCWLSGKRTGEIKIC